MSTAVLLVAGAAEDEEIWDAVAGELQQAKTLLLPASSNVHALGRSVSDALSCPSVIVGHSLGGAACLIAAAAHPDLVDALVIVACGSSLPVHESIWTTLREGGEFAASQRLAAAASAQPRTGSRDDQISARMQRMMDRAQVGTLERHLRACAAFQAPPIAVPVTVVAGSADRMVAPSLCRDLASQATAQLVMLEGVGHQIPWENPEAVISAVRGRQR